MPHIMTIFCAVIAVIALVFFSFQQEEVPKNLLNDKAQHSIETLNPNNTEA